MNEIPLALVPAAFQRLVQVLEPHRQILCLKGLSRQAFVALLFIRLLALCRVLVKITFELSPLIYNFCYSHATKYSSFKGFVFTGKVMKISNKWNCHNETLTKCETE